jgi:hypothetical protein
MRQKAVFHIRVQPHLYLFTTESQRILRPGLDMDTSVSLMFFGQKWPFSKSGMV